jgi:1,4-dihydroxy-2-naphthoyl-CoA synthase
MISTSYGHYDRMTMERSLYGSEALEGWQAFSQRRSPDWVPPDMRKQGRL